MVNIKNQTRPYIVDPKKASGHLVAKLDASYYNNDDGSWLTTIYLYKIMVVMCENWTMELGFNFAIFVT